MATTNNGCCGSSGSDSSNQQDTSCPPQQDDLYLTKVTKVNAATGNNPSPICEFDTPFFDESISNDMFTIPKVGETFLLQVCSSARWAVNQWVYIDGVGRFPVVGHFNATTITLRNGIDSTTEIPGNPEPGDTYTGAKRLWSIDPISTEDTSLAQTQIEAVLQDPNYEHCVFLNNAVNSDEAEAVGVLLDPVQCDPCGTDNSEGKVGCFRKFLNIILRRTTIGLPLMPEVVEVTETYTQGGIKVSNAPVPPVHWQPSTGNLVKFVPATGNNTGVTVYQDGVPTWLPIPTDFAVKLYALGVLQDGTIGWINTDYPSFTYIGTDLALGAVNWKSVIESAINGVQLPNSGFVQVQVSSIITVPDGDPAGTLVNLEMQGTGGDTIINTIGAGQGVSMASKIVDVDLANPAETLAFDTTGTTSVNPVLESCTVEGVFLKPSYLQLV